MKIQFESDLNYQNNAINPSNLIGLNMANMPYLEYLYYNILNQMIQLKNKE